MEKQLHEHIGDCEAALAVIAEENRMLLRGEPADEALLERKRTILARLTDSLEALQKADKSGRITDRARLEKGRQIILKALLLDRENEQLLLKSAFVHRAAPALRPSASQLQRLYSQSGQA